MTKTDENLKAAFVGEAKASIRLLGYAEKAEQEDYPQVAKLFRAAAAAARSRLGGLAAGLAAGCASPGVETEKPDVPKYPASAFFDTVTFRGKLTEINVTSPTGIQEAQRLSGEPLASRVLEAVEALVHP